MGSRRRHDETLLRIQPWVRRVRRIIGARGWLARLQWFVKNLAPVSALEGEPSVPPGVSVRPGSPDDAVALAPLIHGRESLAWRFTRGDIVLVAEVDREVVGCTWLTNRPLRPSYFPIRVRPEPGEWYNYGLALLREHRMRGLGRALSRMAMEEARRRGGTRVFGHASRFNRIAAASHAAAGYVTVEESSAAAAGAPRTGARRRRDEAGGSARRGVPGVRVGHPHGRVLRARETEWVSELIVREPRPMSVPIRLACSRSPA